LVCGASFELVVLLVGAVDFSTAALALALASCASFRCCHMLTEGIGAALSSFCAAFSDFVEPSLLSDTLAALSVGFDVCDCLSQVESEVPFGIAGMSSSLANVDVDAVPMLGDDVLETTFLEEPVVVDLDSWSTIDSGFSESPAVSATIVFEVCADNESLLDSSSSEVSETWSVGSFGDCCEVFGAANPFAACA
jgi:hypothetical protein